MSATSQTSTNSAGPDYKVADIGLADFGRKASGNAPG